MSTIETRPFWPYSYILWKVVHRSTWCMYITHDANIIWRSGHTIRSSFLLDFFFLHQSCRRVFTALCNMIVLAARFTRTLFGRQIVLSLHKKIVKENTIVIHTMSNFKNSCQCKKCKHKFCVIDTLKTPGQSRPEFFQVNDVTN